MRLLFTFLILNSFLITQNTAIAQENRSKSVKAKEEDFDEKDPKAVLVQLSSEKNRIEALTRARMYKEVGIVKKDALQVQARTKLDFHDHFNFCPVYYYMDTNIDLIKKKHFDGILQNEAGEIVQNPVISNGSNDHIVCFYGYPVSQPYFSTIQTDTSRYIYDSHPPFGIGLVVLNSNFLQLTYFYKPNGLAGLIKNSKKSPYSYTSAKFNIEYFPFAYSLQLRLAEGYRGRNGIRGD